MYFQPSKMSNYHVPKIFINNEEIKFVKSFKFLGIYINDKLNWETHIDLLRSKLSRNIGIINNIKYTVLPNHLA